MYLDKIKTVRMENYDIVHEDWWSTEHHEGFLYYLQERTMFPKETLRLDHIKRMKFFN